MTSEDYAKLMPGEIVIKVATLCGWRRHTNNEGKEVWYNKNHEHCLNHDTLPYYFNDLNACREFEERLSEDQAFDYESHLQNICWQDDHRSVWAATAAQRCEAFVLTMEAVTEE